MDKGAATVMTFSIFLCGCKLSGTRGLSNLSTLSAAKVRIIYDVASKKVCEIIPHTFLVSFLSQSAL